MQTFQGSLMCRAREGKRVIAQQTQRSVSSGRFVFLALCCVAWIGVLIFRLSDVQGRKGGYWQELASRQQDTQINIQGARGSIFDAENRPLAVSVETVSLGVHPRQIKEPKMMAVELAEIAGGKPSDYLPALTADKSFAWLARALPGKVAQQVLAKKFTGVESIPEFHRYYPQGSIAGAVIGRVSRDGQGQSGVELAFEKQLGADNFSLDMRRDALGRLVADDKENPNSTAFKDMFGFEIVSQAEAASTSEPKAAQDFRDEGQSVSLTLDAVLQSILEEEIARGKTEAKARRAFGLMLDAETGQVLALAQSESFDPNSVGGVSSEALRNVLIQDSFEPGSTFKPLVAALSYDAGVVNENSVLNCENGRYQFGSHVIRDVHPYGDLTFTQILQKSSNICMTKIGARLGEEKLFAGIQQLGFGAQTGLELPGEGHGILRDVKNWAKIDVATHSFGQGIGVTGAQMVAAYAALANGGTLYRPTLIQSKNGTRQGVQVFSKKAADTVALALESVTTGEGTGLKAAIPGLHVSGKTGTAQKPRADGRGYEETKVLASFIGFVQGKQLGLKHTPVLLIAIDEPGTSVRYGGVVAAPVFRRVMERSLQHMLTSKS